MFGYTGVIARVDLSKSYVVTESYEDQMALNFIGGSGAATKLLFDETNSETDPLGPDNLLIFSTGPYTGTGIPSSDRIQTVGKSPLLGFMQSPILEEHSAGE